MIKTFLKNDILDSKYTNVSDISNILEPYIKYYVDENNVKIDNPNYNEIVANECLNERILLRKKHAPHEEKVNVNHDNYLYSYARLNADDGYGSIESQIEYLTENGLEAWQKKVLSIKAKYPKK